MQILEWFKLLKNSILFKNYAVYTFGAFFQKGIAYFLIPVYIGVLSPTEFGQLDQVNTLMSILSIFCSFGLAQVFYSDFYSFKNEGKRTLLKDIVTSYLVFSVPVLIVFFILFLFFSAPILHFKANIYVIIIAFTISFLLFFQSIFFSFLRLTGKSVKFIVINLSTGIFFLVSNIILVYFFRVGIIGIFWSNLIVSLAILVVATLIYRKAGGTFKLSLNNKILYYLKLGSPFILSSIFYWLINYADRWIIGRMLTPADVGYYSLAFKFSQIYDPLIIAPILGAFIPHLFKKLSEKRYQTNFNILIPGILLLFGALTFVSVFATKFSINLANNESYNSSYSLIPFLVMGFAFNFIAQLTGSVLVFYKRTTLLAINIIIAGILNITLNLLLIRCYGLIGSAIANLISNAIWALLTLYQSKIQLRKVIRGEK